MKDKKLKKINNWIDPDIYKEARKAAIDREMHWKEAIEKALILFIEDTKQRKEE